MVTSSTISAGSTGSRGSYVIDASIIPDAPSGFPHVITIMAAEHLAARLQV